MWNWCVGVGEWGGGVAARESGPDSFSGHGLNNELKVHYSDVQE